MCEILIRKIVERPLLLHGDYNEIYSALSNLLFNAVQYTPTGGRITLNWLADAKETGVRTQRP